MRIRTLALRPNVITMNTTRPFQEDALEGYDEREPVEPPRIRCPAWRASSCSRR